MYVFRAVHLASVGGSLLHSLVVNHNLLLYDVYDLFLSYKALQPGKNKGGPSAYKNAPFNVALDSCIILSCLSHLVLHVCQSNLLYLTQILCFFI